MESVALFLQREVKAFPVGSVDFDLFGRSSFNRYYYAAYLHVRTTLGGLNQEWLRAPHKTIPELLEGAVLEEIKKQKARAARIKDREAIDICARGQSSAHELARLMRGAYATRVTADYNPSIPIEPDEQGRFKLNLISITVAHEWPTLARAHSAKIVRAWNLQNE